MVIYFQDRTMKGGTIFMLKKKLLIIAGIIAGTALLGLVGVFLFNSKEYFSNQFGRNTYISNTNVSSMTVDEAVAVMNESKGFSVEFSKNGEVRDMQ